MNISQNIKDLCIEKEINIIQLAKSVKIQDSLLYKYINENSLPTVNNIVKLANFFNCSINYLTGLSDNPAQYKFSDTYDKELFFERYCELLKNNNLSHYAFCKTINISKSNYFNWKKGGIPYLDTLYKIAEYFGVSIDYLIGRSNKK